MRSHATTTGTDLQSDLLRAFADIQELATGEPGTIDEANDALYAIEDKAAEVLNKR